MTEYVGTTTTFPYSAVVYIRVTYSNGLVFTGSGVVVDRNSVLTAAHMVYDGANGAVRATNIQVFPGHDGSSNPLGSYTPVSYDYNRVDADGDGKLSRSESAYDAAVLHFDVPIGDATGWMNFDSEFTSGPAHVTGYPGIYGGRQTDDQGTVQFSGNILDISQLDINPGNSGGPIWVQGATGPAVVGIVSTGSWAWSPHGTYGAQVLNWITSDDVLLNNPPAVTDDFPANASTTGRVAVGSPAHGKIDTPTDIDWFAVTLTAGTRYTFNLRGSATSGGTLSDPLLRLLNGSGSSLASDDDSGIGLDSQLVYTPTVSGTYYLAASAALSIGTGTYTLDMTSVVPPPPTPTIIGPTPSTVLYSVAGYSRSFAVDRGSALILIDGKSDTADATLTGTLNTPAKSIDYDTWSVTFLPNYVYRIEDVRGAVGGLSRESVSLLNPSNDSFYWSVDATTSTTTAGATSGRLYFTTATTLNLTITSSAVGSYKINIYADAATTTVTGTSLSETLTGTAGVDVITGLGGDDTIRGNGGNDMIDGGTGRDTAVFNGNRADYTITRTGTGFQVANERGTDGTDTLTSIEILQFADQTLFNLGSADAEVVRLYQAALGRVPDVGGFLVQAQARDGGTSLQQLAANFLGSAEFRARYGASPTDDAYVTALYQNVLGRMPSSAEITFQVNEALHKGVGRDALLVGFVNSSENIVHTAGLFV